MCSGPIRSTILSRRAKPAIVCVVGMLFAIGVQAGEERIFADGFDPCCSIGGTVSGLSGSGLVLHLQAGSIDENRPVAGNGLYRFGASVPAGSVFTLSISTQPSGQTCSISIAGGTMGSNPVDNADVTCDGNLKWDSGNWGEDWN